MEKRLYLLLIITIMLSNVSAAQEINISKLSLDQKIGQMVMVPGDVFNESYIYLGIGGIFINGGENKTYYQELISHYQNASPIKLLVAADMEGYWNPFSFYKSKTFGEIEDEKAAYKLGVEQGKILKEVGINLDFSPIVEVKNNVWPGRTFIGNKSLVNAKIKYYIRGLQEQGILATAKHYPGGSMLKDPHKYKVYAKITKDDLAYFDVAMDENVAAIMVGHPIVTGTLNSKGKQATVSKEIIEHLRQSFNGLIITDSINMRGLSWSYFFNKKRIYIDAVKAGNDIILDSNLYGCSSQGIQVCLKDLKKAVHEGEIPEKQIDESVKRILKAKGYEVVY